MRLFFTILPCICLLTIGCRKDVGENVQIKNFYQNENINDSIVGFGDTWAGSTTDCIFCERFYKMLIEKDSAQYSLK